MESDCSYLDAPYDKENGRVPHSSRLDFFRAEVTNTASATALPARISATRNES
jgi:hypothetical protein